MIESEQNPRIGQIAAGASITLIGVGWLLEVTNVADIPWSALLPAVLMVIGAALIAGARHGPQSGLIVLGVVISIVVVLASIAEVILDVPFGGGVGEKTHTVVRSEDAYRWGIGKMTVDLRNLDSADGQLIEASLGIGELVVIVPPDLTVQVDAHAGIGEVVVLDRRSSGIDVDIVTTDPGPRLRLEVDVGFGKLEVRR